jgi:hypothetical protein
LQVMEMISTCARKRSRMALGASPISLPQSWKFHKGKYVKIVSAYYDYKHERNMRKYGESRPHDFAAWPLKRL